VHAENSVLKSDLRLPLRGRCGLRHSGLLRSQ